MKKIALMVLLLVLATALAGCPWWHHHGHHGGHGGHHGHYYSR
jgi:hypothetical protein